MSELRGGCFDAGVVLILDDDFFFINKGSDDGIGSEEHGELEIAGIMEITDPETSCLIENVVYSRGFAEPVKVYKKCALLRHKKLCAGNWKPPTLPETKVRLGDLVDDWAYIPGRSDHPHRVFVSVVEAE